MDLSSRLLSWYQQNGRSLPWRGSKNAYHIWISEIILQQTRVDQGISYFYRFVTAFPDVYSLAAAPGEKVLRLWQGLGYYTRARNLHKAAMEVVEKHNGMLPGSCSELEQLPGVGPYTAAAVSSMAFGEVVPALDGNVYRVLSRLFAIDDPMDTARGKQVFKSLASDLISTRDPGGFNQAMMDFGSLVCKPLRPLCSTCIFRYECLAFSRNAVTRFPVRSPKKPPRDRYFVYAVLEEHTNTGEHYFYIQKRTARDIWKHLHEFPLMECPNDPMKEEARIQSWLSSICGNEDEWHFKRAPVYMKHQLTHQTIHACFVTVGIDGRCAGKLVKAYMRTTKKAFDELAKPRLIERFLAMLD